MYQTSNPKCCQLKPTDVVTARILVGAVAAITSVSSVTVAQSSISHGAPTADSLARLVMARFASGTLEAFDSVYPDPLGRDVVRAAVQQAIPDRVDVLERLFANVDRSR